ncbi:hypothetical protein MO867_12315 [Microbulbifer sp. OS29]|uniref:Uncharacterized protein n=1 Tax=Microbulbifer okhotskensis TaxID=2926617 RepID=A0A9X2J6X6_9GAMM|nr:hypothetical protein [Microbulbifer okhotskensis]MCO1335115.1 hypothetical protein [Microbulbifer okhotskensis]
MKRVQSKLLLATAIAMLFASCDGGGVSVEPKTVDNSFDNTGGVSSGENPYATIESTGIQGEYNSGNCYYGTDFVSATNPYRI